MYQKLTARLNLGCGTCDLDGMSLDYTRMTVDTKPGEPAFVTVTFPVRELDLELTGDADKPAIVLERKSPDPQPDLSKGADHFLRNGGTAKGDADPIGPGEPGTREQPFRVMPSDWSIPYAAWCVCSSCLQLGRSTIAFDFYGNPGEPLRCETCNMHALMTRQ